MERTHSTTSNHNKRALAVAYIGHRQARMICADHCGKHVADVCPIAPAECSEWPGVEGLDVFPSLKQSAPIIYDPQTYDSNRGTFRQTEPPRLVGGCRRADRGSVAVGMVTIINIVVMVALGLWLWVVGLPMLLAWLAGVAL